MPQNLYTVISEYLRSLIASNPTPNYKLPSESQVMMKYNASRMTVRRAFAELEDKNLIYKIKGKGAFVKNDQSIRFLTSDRIAFVYPNPENKHPREILRGVCDFFEPKNINVNHFETHNDSEREQNILQHIRESNYKGIILMPVDKEYFDSALLRLIVDDFPTMLVDRKLNGLHLSCISSNHLEIGYRATAHLAKTRRHIAYISANTTTSSIHDRLSGYLKAVESAGLESHVFSFESLSADNLFEEKLEKLAKFFAHNRIDGVVCNSGYYTAITVRAFSKLGKQIGKDYEIVAIDRDSDLISKTIGHDIPYIEQNSYLIGQTAAKYLYHRIYNNATPESKLIEIRERFSPNSI